MNSELQAVFYSLFPSVLILFVSLTIGTGFKRSGMRTWNIALISQGVGWGLLGLSTTEALDPTTAVFLATVGVFCVTVCIGISYVAAAYYLGRKPKPLLAYGPAIATAALFTIVHGDQTHRLIWINLAQAVPFASLAWYMRPRAADGIGIRWRRLAFITYAISGLVLVAGALIVQYHLIGKDSSMYCAIAFQAWPVFNIWATLAFLLAHRDEAEQELRRLASRDGLTGLLNRRSAMERASEQIALRQREWRPLTVNILDLDHFKQINDTHGHPRGDQVLQLFARLLKENLRPGDTAGRHGGEEFLLVLPGGPEAAQAIDQRLREALLAASTKELGIPCNFSAGAATLEPESLETLDQLIARADIALYEAKHAGRGRMAIAAPAAAELMGPRAEPSVPQQAAVRAAVTASAAAGPALSAVAGAGSGQASGTGSAATSSLVTSSVTPSPHSSPRAQPHALSGEPRPST